MSRPRIRSRSQVVPLHSVKGYRLRNIGRCEALELLDRQEAKLMRDGSGRLYHDDRIQMCELVTNPSIGASGSDRSPASITGGEMQRQAECTCRGESQCKCRNAGTRQARTKVLWWGAVSLADCRATTVIGGMGVATR